ncbi:MAG: hypothetical protein K6E50_03280 [Lachnospiraceae bacterium]|nr:hypothetical protein [Lachnospiraceae bacterium]
MNMKNPIHTQNFIMLAIKAAKANGIVVKEEKELIRKYCRNIGCDKMVLSEKDDFTTDDLADFFISLEPGQKQLVLEEILRVMYADHCFDESECNFVYDLAERIGIAEEDLNRMVATV